MKKFGLKTNRKGVLTVVGVVAVVLAFAAGLYDYYGRLASQRPRTPFDPGEFEEEEFSFDDMGEDETTPTATPSSTPTPRPLPVYSRCDLFDDEVMSFFTLDSRAGPSLYVYNPEGWPGIEHETPNDLEPWEYTATLNNSEAVECTFQGYKGRLYCSFPMADMKKELLQQVNLYVNGCSDAFFTFSGMGIFNLPGPSPIPPNKSSSECKNDLGQSGCQAAGGTYDCSGPACLCVCP